MYYIYCVLESYRWVDEIYRIADLHEDIAYFLQTGPRELVQDFDKEIPGRHADIPRYLRSGVRMVFSSIFPAVNTWDPQRGRRLREFYGREFYISPSVFPGIEVLLEQVKIYYRLEETYRDYVKIVYRATDIEEFYKGERILFLVSLEGADVLSEPGDLEILYRLGVRSLTVTWNYDNRYGSSCMSRRDYGLTDLGAELVAEANRLGIVLDISHSSKRTALDILSASRLPVIASHSNYYGRKSHARNIDDEVLEGIKRTGGVVGFTLITSTIGGRESIEDLVEHIVDVRERFGPEILAIGTDFFGIEKTPRGLEDVSRLPDLLGRLAERGFSDNDLRKISSENVLRVLREHVSRWRD